MLKEIVSENKDKNAGISKAYINNSDDSTRVSIDYYLRFKIFDDRGAERLSSYNIDIDEDTTIRDFAARVIKPDGTKIESGNSDLIKRDIVIVDNDRKRRYSLPISGLVPGSIVDIQWRESYLGYTHNKFFILSDIAPIHKAHIDILPDSRMASCYFYNHAPILNNDGRGHLATELENIPGKIDEPWSPSPMTLKSWIFMRYASNKDNLNAQSNWMRYSSWIWDKLRFRVRDAGKEVRRKAIQLTQGVKNREEKLKSLYNFCVSEMSNLNATGSGYTDADIRDMDEDSTVEKVLKNKRGFAYEITMLFAALAHEAGFEVNLACCNDRTYIDWNIEHANSYMVPVLHALVRNGDKWEFYNPGIPNLAFGMIYYGNEGTGAVMGDKNKAALIVTPESPSSFSKIIRTGNFELDEEGTLRGSGSFEYSGHCAYTTRILYAKMLPESRVDGFKKDIAAIIPSAEVNNVVFENLGNPEENLIIRFELECTAYADVTGERMIVQPGVFQKNTRPMFIKDKRTTDISFGYMWETNDKISIGFPEEFELEDGTAPKSIVNTPQLGHVAQLALSRRSPTLHYSRELKIGVRTLPVAVYSKIKILFDAIHNEDKHVVSLRRKGDLAQTKTLLNATSGN